MIFTQTQPSLTHFCSHTKHSERK